jgi:hypothetical protein
VTETWGEISRPSAGPSRPPARASCGCRTCQPQASPPGPSESTAGTQDTAVILHSVEELAELEDRVPNVAEIHLGEVVLDVISSCSHHRPNFCPRTHNIRST